MVNIPVQTAHAIVREVTAAVHRPVNLMDNSGCIIASTDPSRIGTCHAGAKRIVDEKLEYLAIGTDDMCNGVKAGINMPLYFRDEIVGVIGISGEWDQIKPYVDLIRKATEVLLLDSYLKESTSAILARRHEYMQSLLFENPSKLPMDFYENGRILGLDIEQPHYCLCLALKHSGAKSAVKESDLINNLERMAILLKPNVLCYRNETQLCLFLPVSERAASPDIFLQRLLQKAALPPTVQPKAGLDETPCQGTDLRFGRQRAETALRSAWQEPDCILVRYDSLTSGLYLNEISRSTKQEFIKHIFRGMEIDEIRSWANLLSVFYACDGSINRAAEQLFIHKNTLQYQLKKLATQTGRDPRSLVNVGLYQTAILFLDSIYGNHAQ